MCSSLYLYQITHSPKEIMKVYLKGEAQKYPELVGLLTEDKLINNKKDLDQILSNKNLEVEKIEINGDQKIIYIKENEKTKNLLQE